MNTLERRNLLRESLGKIVDLGEGVLSVMEELPKGKNGVVVRSLKPRSMQHVTYCNDSIRAVYECDNGEGYEIRITRLGGSEE